MATLFLIGRILLGGYFLYNAMNHLANVGMMAQFASAKGVPMPALAVLGSGVLLFIGGVSILLGVFTKIGIAAVVLFLVVVTPAMHNFWAIPDPQLQMFDMINFMKNMALLGALLMLLAVPEPWPYSLRLGARRRVAA